MRSTQGLLFCIFLAVSTSLGARDWYVSPQGANGYEVGGGWATPANLRYTLENIAQGDTLRMSPGIYEMSQSFVTDKSFAIVAGGENVKIQSLGSDRVFVFNGGSSQSVLLRGIEISGGNATQSTFKPNCGGAIYVASLSVVTLQDVTLSENKGSASPSLEGDGGAIYNEGELNLTGGTLLQANTASLYTRGYGGAVYNHGGTVRISGTTAFKNNIASGKGENNMAYGGAIYHTGQGAHIKIEGPSGVELSSGNVPSFVGNIATIRTGMNLRAEGGIPLSAYGAYGGAIFVAEGTVLDVHRAYIEGNIASYGSCDGFGGAIYAVANSSVSMEYVILSGNKAATEGSTGSGYGGAIWNAGECSLRHVQLIGNIASSGNGRGYGGGLYDTYTSGDRSKNGKLYFGGEIIFKDNIALTNSYILSDPNEVTPTAFGGAIAIMNTLPEGNTVLPEVSITTDRDDNDPGFSLLFEGNIAGKTILGDAGGGAIGIKGANVILGDDIYDQNIIFRNNVALDSPGSSEGGYGGAIMGIGIGNTVSMETIVCYGADFKGNVATMSLTGEGKGGAIAAVKGAKIHAVRGNFEENYANGNPESTGKAWGGAYAGFRMGSNEATAVFIAAGESMLTINGVDGVLFRNNAATKGKGQGFGGAASITDGGLLRFSDRTCIESNVASASASGEEGKGGGIYVSNEDNPSLQAQLQLREAIIQKNKASVGGGIWLGNIGWLQFNEYSYHKQQTWVMNNEAPVGPNIYPTNGVCLVEIRQVSSGISCIPEYNTHYAVMKGNLFKFALTIPEGHQAAVIKTSSNGASVPNPVSVNGTTWKYSVAVDADVVTIWCSSSVAIRKPLSVVTKSSWKVIVLKPGERDTLEYLLNPFIPASTFDPTAIQWKTTDYGVAEVSSIDASGRGEIIAKEEGFAYITVGLRSDYTPNVFPAGAFSGNFNERDTVGVYVIDSDFSETLDPTLGHIHYKDSSKWLSVQLPEGWSVLGEKAITWRLSDPTVAELKQYTNTSGHIRFVNTGRTKLIFELKMKPGYSVSYDLCVIDTLKLIGLERGIFNVGIKQLCVLSETGLPEEYRELKWKLSNPIAGIESVADNLAYLQMEAFGETTLTVSLVKDTTKYVSVKFSVVKLVLNFPEVVLANEWTAGSVQFIPDIVLPVKWVKPTNGTESEIHKNGNKAAIRFLKKDTKQIVSVEIEGTDVKDSVRVLVIDTPRIVFLLPEGDIIEPSGGTMQVPSNENKTLRLSVRPEIQDVDYMWSSDNETIAKIGEYDGLLTTVARGAVIISATCVQNHNLVIKQRIFVKDISISDSILFLPLGDNTSVFTLPADIDQGRVLWATTNPNVVNIDKGKIIVGNIPGTAVISAKPLLSGPDEIPISSIQRTVYAVKLSLEDKAMPMGTSAYFQVQAEPSGVVTRATDLKWKSSSPSIVEINEQGYAHVVSATTDPITVTASLKTNERITVSAVVKVNPVQSVAIQSPSYGDPSFEYEMGGRLYKFGVIFTPANASDTIVKWENLTPEIFSIEDTADTWAEIKVLKVGMAQIRATTLNGCTDTYNFTTVPNDIQIELDKTVLSLRRGETYKLSAHINPEVKTNPEFTFVSEKAQVATVDIHTGLIEAKEYGDTHVTVSFVYGVKTYKADCHVKVENAVDSIGIKAGTLLVGNGDTLSIDKYGGDKQLQITFYPSDATNKQLRFQSSQPLVATVTSLGWVRPLSEGYTDVAVQTVGSGGDTLKTFVVKVQTPLDDIRLNSHNLALGKGRAYPLRVIFEPEDVSVRPSLQWTSNDPSIVSVDGVGWLEPKKEGQTFVRVVTADARFSDTCWINVVTFPESLTLNKRRLELNVGMSAILTPTLLPEDVTNKGVQWRTDNAAVATVQSDNGDGRVTAHGVGTATITVITEDGTLSASCVVTVESLVSGVYLSHSSLLLHKEESRLLRAEIEPLDAYRMNIEWSSDNNEVVEVTTAGKVIAKGGGTARITAKTENGFEAVCQISVSVPVRALEIGPPLLVAYAGQEFSLTATLAPQDASEGDVIWTVDNPSILEILSRDNSKVCYFSAKKSGWVLIQVESSDRQVVRQKSLYVMDIFGPDNQSPVIEAVKPMVTYHDGVLRVTDLEGFQVHVLTIHGKTCAVFRTAGINEELPLNLPSGIYILNARNGKERFALKFIVR